LRQEMLSVVRHDLVLDAFKRVIAEVEALV
jgi:hypothetical protein